MLGVQFDAVRSRGPAADAEALGKAESSKAEER